MGIAFSQAEEMFLVSGTLQESFSGLVIASTPFKQRAFSSRISPRSTGEFVQRVSEVPKRQASTGKRIEPNPDEFIVLIVHGYV